MIRVDISALVNQLNPLCRHMLEEAAALCVSQQMAEIRAEHVLMKALETPFSDIRQILKQAKIDEQAVKSLLQPAAGESLQGRDYPAFSPLLIEWLQDSWLLASTEMQHNSVRSGVLLLVLLMTPRRYLSAPLSRLLANINCELLRQRFDEWVHNSAESETSSTADNKNNELSAANTSSLLSRFCWNITEKARLQQLDPVLCRDTEIDLMTDILCRRRKNNPIIIGEAGVGKSALAEGLALRIIAGNVPEKLRGVEILALDLGAVQAGASVRGEFEKRFKGIMQEVKTAPYPVILFIDEAHTLIGAGNQAGGLDISNLIKPALARGELRTVAATTWSEYKKYIEKDAALSRRFQPVKVAEPDVTASTVILRGLRSVYEQAHQVLIDEDALCAASELSARYISGRQLPDKAIDVLDTACARVAINLTTPPRQISRLHTQLQQRELEIRQLERQQRIALGDNLPHLEQLQHQQQQDQQTLDTLQTHWQQQREQVEKIIALRAHLLSAETKSVTEQSSGQESGQTVSDVQQQLSALETELVVLQQEHILVSPHVDKAQIAAVIAEWTGVPLTRISQNELDILTRLPQYLSETIKGQTLAVSRIHQHLLTARADLRRSGRPLGAFLLAGPSGVGKTETVLCLTDLLFGGRHYLTTINMSEYQEKHTVSRLIGSPPGYVGYGEGGVLTEAIRQKPYSVVLLDEVEKAHPDVLNLFYQAFDKGELADGEGRSIDCKNVVFFLTSNLGFQTIVQFSHEQQCKQGSPEQPENDSDEQQRQQQELLADALYPELAAFFKPALLARMEVVPYLPLDTATLLEIVHNKLARLATLLQSRFSAEVDIDDSVAEEILRRANRSENGARMLESVIDGALLPVVSLQLLQRLSAGQPVRRVRFATEKGQFISTVES